MNTCEACPKRRNCPANAVCRFMCGIYENENKPRQTNGERIRAMSNEEIARANVKYKLGIFVAQFVPLKSAFWTTWDEAVRANLDWLNAPADGEKGKKK